MCSSRLGTWSLGAHWLRFKWTLNWKPDNRGRALWRLCWHDDDLVRNSLKTALFTFGRIMATTGPYIIYKSSQLCAAVRSNVDFDNTVRKRIRKVNFTFDNVDTLPPRLNLKSLQTAVNAVCQQVREKRETFLMNRRELKQTKKGLREQFYSHKKKVDSKTCGNSIAGGTPALNVSLLNTTGFLWDKERITDFELYRLEILYCFHSMSLVEH